MRKYILITLLCGYIASNANTVDYSFRHLTLNDGLSNSHVNSIVQDKNGFIWIGTVNGLNKYDGYKFTYYYSNSQDNTSLISDNIMSLLVDENNVLWIGTFRGLSKYNSESDDFTSIPFHQSDVSKSRKPILDIKPGINNTLWLATSGNGLIHYSISNNSYKTYLPAQTNSNSITSEYILSNHIDVNGNVFIGTDKNGFDVLYNHSNKFENFTTLKPENNTAANSVLCFYELNTDSVLVGTRDGLHCYNRNTKTVNPFFINGKKLEISKGSAIHSIIKDKNNRLWISAKGDGLICINLINNNLSLLKSDKTNPTSIINDNTRSLFEDNQGNIWAVSYQGGINILPNKIKIFTNYNLYDPNAIYESNTVSCMATDKNNNIYVGTDGGGMKYINRKTKKIKHYYPKTNKNLLNTVPDKVIMSLLVDNNENVWIGTYIGGLSVLNTTNNQFKNYTNSNNINSIGSNYVSSIIQDKRGNIWVGTNGAGLNLYRKNTDDFARYTMQDTINETNLVNDWINALLEDNNGRIWIGTYWGLSVFDPFSNHFINYIRNDGDIAGLSSNVVYSLCETSKNEIWIGTRKGLNKFLPQSNTFQVYNSSHGLPGNAIYGIKEDKSGNLWLSTNRGVSNLNTSTEEIQNYFESDGLASNEFFRGSIHKSSNGEIFFGSIKGLNSFYPDSIREKYKIPKPYISEFRIFEKKIRPGHEFDKRILINKPISNTEFIQLKHRDNSFTFELSALDFILPGKNLYQYKMEGFDINWKTLPTNQRSITYTNLDAGTYKFKFKASSIDNRWDDSYNTLTIEIDPPIYKSWWAIVIYYFVLVGLMALIYYILVRRVKLNAQIKLERFNREKSEELNQAKLRFFTNISHEFRTPITLIVGPMEKILADKNFSKKYYDTFNMMLKNANRLLRLVNQLMDLRKVESGSMKLKVTESNLLSFIEDIKSTFAELALQKQIDFTLVKEVDELTCWFDADKIDKILFNLLSNAFKHTPKHGEISIKINRTIHNSKNYACIEVKDSGKGIPKEELDRIFERFYQTSNNNVSEAGSGVGLSLTYNLVEIHKGVIKVDSEEGSGATFQLLLPLFDDAYSDDEKKSLEVIPRENYSHEKPELESEIVFKKQDTNEEQPNKVKILIVEDNHDLRKYIANELSEQYEILEAENGKVGLEVAINKLPELIISDVMMPEMDGLELCKSIKENLLTNHIPVILLTAKTSIEQRIEGIEQGADSYIPKPFHPEHLHIRVKKLIELRATLKAKFSDEMNSAQTEIETIEDKFLKKITKIIHEHISKTEMSIEWLSKEMGMSRGHLHRKLKLLTDKSPSEFVRVIKLNKSLALLKNKEYNISEVCYMVGFNSPSYFTNCFKAQFKMSPTEFVERDS